MKKILTFCLTLLLIVTFSSNSFSEENVPIHMAVEFVDHAASAYIAREKEWFKEEGLEVSAFDNYITGMALSAALGRGDINTAYMCLIPAICSYANGKVPIKIVAGTHKYGYGLLVDGEKIKNVRDLEKPGIKIGCPREGSAVDVLFNKMIEKYKLDKEKILKNVRRMPPPKILLALKMGQLDAGFCPEQYPSMGEKMGFKILLRAQELWPEMQGSVLVVRDDLIKQYPQKVNDIVKITEKSTEYIHRYPEESAEIVAKNLQAEQKDILPLAIGNISADLKITPAIIKKSLSTQMECTTDLDPAVVQDIIDYLSQLGYIKRFDAENILDLRFLNNE